MKIDTLLIDEDLIPELHESLHSVMIEHPFERYGDHAATDFDAMLASIISGEKDGIAINTLNPTPFEVCLTLLRLGRQLLHHQNVGEGWTRLPEAYAGALKFTRGIAETELHLLKSCVGIRVGVAEYISGILRMHGLRGDWELYSVQQVGTPTLYEVTVMHQAHVLLRPTLRYRIVSRESLLT